MKVNASDIRLHIDEYLGLALDGYASLRIDIKDGPIVPGEFLDRDAAMDRQHGLTGLFIWEWLARRARILDDMDGRFGNACQLLGYLSSLIESLKAGADQCPAQFAGRNLEWEKLKSEFSITTSKRSLFILTILDRDDLLKELGHICSMAICQGLLWGWNAKLCLNNTSKPDEMLTAYVLSILGSSFIRSEGDGGDWHSDERFLKLAPVLYGAARLVWNHCKRPSGRQSSGSFQKNDAQLRKIFFLNTLHRLFDSGLIREDSPIAFSRSDVRKILSHTIVRIYNNSKNDPLYIASDLMYFFRDSSVNKGRYVRMNGDVLLLEGMIFVYGASGQALNSPECAKLVERVQSAFSEEFSEDGNGQRFAVYSAYHAVRALDMLTMINKEKEKAGVLSGAWSGIKGFSSRLSYAWSFRRGVFVESLVTLIGFLGAFGSFLLFSLDPSRAYLQPMIVPFLVLGFVSSLKLISARSST